MKKALSYWLLLAMCAIVAVSCSKDSKKEDIPSAAIVTLGATDMSYCGATLNGKLNVSEDVMPFVEFGFEYSTSAEISTPNKLVISSIGLDKKFQCALDNLKERTEYMYRAYIRYTNTGVFVYGGYKSFTTTAFEIVPSGQENGYGYVDLGLSVKWATCNVGANKPEEYGSYFAWGETAGSPYIPGKTEDYTKSFDWSSYRYCNGSEVSITKYSTDSYCGTVDNVTMLALSDDAARANWGGSWRIPTATEIDELLNNCTWTWTTQNGVYGYRVTSNITGYTDKSIFLPAAGLRDEDRLEYVDNADSFGYYWTSSLYTDFCGDAYILSFESDNHMGDFSYRCWGLSVRPVCTLSDNIGVAGVLLDKSSLLLEEAEGTETLIATVSPSDATDKSVTWSSSNTEVAQVDANGKVTAVADGTAIITVTTTDGNFTANCTVTVKTQSTASGSENGHDYVDLGLPSGLKWATCNVGASNPEEFGSYFAWGETVGDPYIEGKTSGYTKSFDWDSYKYCNGSDDSMTKYCKDSFYGTVDNKTTLELSDDAAHVNWGGSWRIPTQVEFGELFDCTWEWTTLNGVNGFMITGKKSGYTNKSIFLPAAGCRSGGNLGYAGSEGCYWTSSLSNSNRCSYALNFNVDYYSTGGLYLRAAGLSVRPVCE
ncbi:MAG: Ig-like domain-containing protein [Bacteroidaceae bacterium]|nr:Ig-like domain-containing protein [Bacteroidaceae bacterium]